ncbi:MAG: Mov34/MPN/PAD-1 family protein [Gammaproteobacteria bacterium]|nr:Mov34/MPN/PAD-1 family protein [Gammaproteobacteria bacterium]
MPVTQAAPTDSNRFSCLTPASLSNPEKSAVVSLALAVLKQRWRPGRSYRTPADIEGLLRLKLAGRRNEVFGVLYLDSRNRLIEMVELFQGTIDAATVYPRIVAQRALENNAAAVVLFHNHPSGVAEPSESDRLITTKLSQALALIDVRIVDHLVVTDGEAASMARRGWI